MTWNTLHSIFSYLGALFIAVFVIRLLDQITETIKSFGLYWRQKAALKQVKLSRRASVAKSIVETLQGKVVNAPPEQFSSPGFYPTEPMSAQQSETILLDIGDSDNFSFFWRLELIASSLRHHKEQHEKHLTLEAIAYIDDVLNQIEERKHLV